ESVEEVREHWWKLFGVAGGMMIRPATDGRDADISPLLQEFLSWVAAEPVHTGETLLTTWLDRDAVRGRIVKQMQRFPILLCPAAAIPAFRHGERTWQVEGKTVRYLDAWSYTEWFNLLGDPAAVV